MTIISINKNRVGAFFKRIYRGNLYSCSHLRICNKKKHTGDAATFIEIFSMAVIEFHFNIKTDNGTI